MKKIIPILLMLFTILGVDAQEFAKIDKSIMDAAYFPTKAAFRAFAKTTEEKTAAEPQIRVLYSRPLAKGRKIFGELVKYNEPWRLGANESTEILFFKDAVFGDKVVKAGRYTLIAVPQKDSWTIYLNAETDGWGNYSYNEAWNVAEVKVPTQNSDTLIEAFSIALYEKAAGLAHLKIGWENTVVEVPIKL